MKKLRYTAAIMCLSLLLGLAAPHALAEAAGPELSSAKSALVGDMSSGRILYSVGAYTRSEPASITKMMTLLLAAEAIEAGEVSLEDRVTASKNCHFDLTDDSSTAHINEGETMSLKDLMYCAALVSANEACNIIAEHISGSAEKFIERMNARAEELGCSGTHFVNTHGLPDKDHYTTARDLFVIACEGMRHPLFAELVSTASYTVAPTNVKDERRLKNSNALINKDSVFTDQYVYEGAVGIKTGRTDAAGYCLVGAVQRDGMNLITVVLGASGDRENRKYFDSFGDTVKLLDWCFDNYSYRSVVEKGFEAGAQPVLIDGIRGELPLCCAEEINALVPNDLDVSALQKSVVLNEDTLSALPEEGAELGKVSFADSDGNVYGTVGLVAAGEIEYEEPPEPETEPEDTKLSDQQKLAVAVVCALSVLTVFVVGLALARRNRAAKSARGRKKAASRRGGKR